jgi:hypothetical protein
MKYVLFFEAPPARNAPLMSPEERKKEYELRQAMMKDEEKYGKTIFPAHIYATGKGLAIVEFKNQKQMANRMAFNFPDGTTGVQYKIMPLIEGSVLQESISEIRK